MRPIKGADRKTGLLIVGIIGCILLGLLIGLNIEGNHISASTQVPGSVEDPLASKSYVDAMIDQALENVEISVSNESVVDVNPTDDGNQTTDLMDDQSVNLANSSLFVVEFIMAGQSVIVEESGELILRSGSAIAIGSASGNGISDVTSGMDIMDGEEVLSNHLIIVPRTDGRGLYITSDAYIMVKGHYSIEN